jgi:hypothetical protein
MALGLLVSMPATTGSSSGAQSSEGRTGPQGASRTPRPSPFVPPEPLEYENRDGWESLFDGRTLTGWEGNAQVWSVENGAITAQSTAERRVGSTHLIWRGGELADFELKMEAKLEGDIHSGIAYRSFIDPSRAPQTGGRPLQIPPDPRWTLYGLGFDYDYDRQMAGNVEERGSDRREIAWRGGIVRTETGKRPRLIGTLGEPDALMNVFTVDDWNQLHIIARGNQFTHIVNGRVVTILIEDDRAAFRPSGLIGLQIEMWGTGRVNFRNVWLKRQ